MWEGSGALAARAWPLWQRGGDRCGWAVVFDEDDIHVGRHSFGESLALGAVADSDDLHGAQLMGEAIVDVRPEARIANTLISEEPIGIGARLAAAWQGCRQIAIGGVDRGDDAHLNELLEPGFPDPAAIAFAVRAERPCRQNHEDWGRNRQNERDRLHCSRLTQKSNQDQALVSIAQKVAYLSANLRLRMEGKLTIGSDRCHRWT